MNLVMMSIPCAEPWSNEVLSTGWNEVSLRLSKPAPNSICGTEHEPKSPIALELELAAVVAAAAAAVVVAATEVAAESLAAEVALPDETVRPWSSTTATLAKLVVIPKTALKARRCYEYAAQIDERQCAYHQPEHQSSPSGRWQR